MSALGFVSRVRSWFGTRDAAAPAGVGYAGGRWSLGPAPERAALALASAAEAAAPPTDAVDRLPQARHDTPPAKAMPAVALLKPLPRPAPRAAEAPRPHLDPLDPAWMESLESLPERLAESMARRPAQASAALGEIEAELEGHGEATRAIRDAVGRLPGLATDQAELMRETNRLLKRQSNLLESMFDGITALRASFRTIDESARRHEIALGQLEASHRAVLGEYQSVLLRMHRRLGRLAALALLMAAAAVGGVAYVAYLALAVAP